jgi:hypothetical protein
MLGIPVPPEARARRAAALAATVALAMTACASPGSAPQSVALTEEQGWPDDAPVPGPDDEGFAVGPVGWLADDRETFTIVTFGSSSCPSIATSIETVDPSLLAISFTQAPAEACTDDLAARTHVFETPEGVGDGALEAELTLSASAFGDAEPQIVRVQLWPVQGDGAGDPESIALETIRGGTLEGITLPPDALETGEPLAFWAEGRARLAVVTWGSSSCPPVPVALEATDPLLVRIDFAPYPADFCTADFAPTTHVLAAPEGVAQEDAVTASITIEQATGAAVQVEVPVRD